MQIQLKVAMQNCVNGKISDGKGVSGIHRSSMQVAQCVRTLLPEEVEEIWSLNSTSDSK